jgi:hypothetical protein
VFEIEERCARRPVEPPIAVMIDVVQLWPPERFRWGADTPPWVRSLGLQLAAGPVPGELVEWLVTSTGDWLARCRFTVSVDHQDYHLDQLIPAKVVRQA